MVKAEAGIILDGNRPPRRRIIPVKRRVADETDHEISLDTATLHLMR
jgi:hypothetical protein